MFTTLRILFFEDSLPDTELMLCELYSFGLKVDWQRVETELDYLSQLNEDFHVIISDFYVNQLNAMRALQLLQQRNLNIPFIVVTGSISEEVAVECMKQGAADYLLKDRLMRLPQAVMHAVQEKKIGDEKRQAEAKLQDSEERFRRLADNAQDIIYRYCFTPTHGFQYINPAVTDLTGYRPQEYYANPNLIFKSSNEGDRQVLQLWSIGKKLTESVILHWVCKDGAIVWTEHNNVPIYDRAGNLIAIEGIARDVTKRKQAEEQLLHYAFRDALTGLPNRVLFMERLEYVLRDSKQHKSYFALLFLDLDRFKVINDSLGHILGDKLLIATARRLQACLRLTDTVARFGGDEFTILLNGVEDISEVMCAARHIQKELSLPFELKGQQIYVTASIGIALSLSSEGYDEPEDMLRDADMAMYRAKILGRARCEIFDTKMYVAAVARLQLETELRQAIERQEFRVYYQPIVSLASGKIEGFEALIRWQHPERGLLSPADFISVAEETGLIILIGYWMIREACYQLQAWLERKSATLPLKISINLSQKQFSQTDLLKQISQILSETGLNAGNLEFEITENVIMENEKSAIATLLQLRHLGSQLSIDDFGIGYSSLSRLQNLPISMLKIDRSFISNTNTSSADLAITEAIIALAHNLGIDVTAEGVETAEQLTQLKVLKCEYGQGYFFSSALDSKAAEALILSNFQW